MKWSLRDNRNNLAQCWSQNDFFSLKLKLRQSDPPVCIKAFWIFLRRHHINFSSIMILFLCFHLWVGLSACILIGVSELFYRWVGVSGHGKYYLQGINNTFYRVISSLYFPLLRINHCLLWFAWCFTGFYPTLIRRKTTRTKVSCHFSSHFPSLHVWKWKRVCLFFITKWLPPAEQLSCLCLESLISKELLSNRDFIITFKVFLLFVFSWRAPKRTLPKSLIYQTYPADWEPLESV